MLHGHRHALRKGHRVLCLTKNGCGQGCHGFLVKGAVEVSACRRVYNPAILQELTTCHTDGQVRTKATCVVGCAAAESGARWSMLHSQACLELRRTRPAAARIIAALAGRRNGTSSTSRGGSGLPTRHRTERRTRRTSALAGFASA